MSTHPLLRDMVRARRRHHFRIIGAAVVAGAGLLVLFLRTGYLQVLQHDHYTTLAHENRIRTRSLSPARGLIRDRNGIVLARNFSVFSLEVVPEETGGVERALGRLGEVLAIGEADEEKFRQRMERASRFESIPLKTRLDEREVAVFSVNRHRFPGIDIHARLLREYPYGAPLAHVVGYVGRISPAEQRRLADDPRYRGSRYVGKTGVELSWERELHGFAGVEQVEVDAQGRTVRVIDSIDAVAGADVYLGLDVDLQLAAHAALSGQVGAIVAIDPRDGSILAFASAPSFDPNRMAQGIDARSYAKLSRDPLRPMFNRALHGQYPPGSVAKPFLAFAGLDQALGLTEDTILCGGRYRLQGIAYEYRDWKKGGHGRIDLERSIEESCDIYFYDLALKLGIDRIHHYLTEFGLGRPTGVDLPREAAGLVPSREWKLAARGRPWSVGETVITGIGQGYVQATPLQLAAATAAIAGRGARFRPRAAVRLVRNAQEEALSAEPLPPVAARDGGRWERVLDGMERVVHGPRGTARGIGRGLDYRIAGKTGTAQVVHQPTRTSPDDLDSIPWKRRDHALFTGFAPLEEPRIVVAVVVEHGGSGGRVAAPIARAVIDYHLRGAPSGAVDELAAGPG